MKPVFADTGFFLALVNARDQYHQAATNLNASLVTPLLTTAWVLWNSLMRLQPVALVVNLALLWLGCVPNVTLKLSHQVQSCLIAVANSTRRDRIKNGR